MIRALLITVIGACVLSCLVVPIIFEALAGVAPWPFSRIFDRVFLFFLLLFMIYFRRAFNLSSILEALQIPSRWRNRVVLLLIGMTVSAGSVALCMFGVFAEGALVTNPRSANEVSGRLLRLVPGALLIALIEELFFRVLLLRRLRDFLPLPIAVFVCSLFYAVVHFITPERSFVFHGESWLEGFLYVPALLQRLLEPGTEIGIAGLFVIGMLLAFAIERLGSVYLAVGLHTGWICAQKMISFLSLRNHAVPLPPGLGGRYSLFGEEWAWFSFMIAIAALGVIAWGKQSRGWLKYS